MNQLDPAIAEVETRWIAAGIPGLYDGCNLPSGGLVESARETLSEKSQSTLVYLHGGGWVVGDLDSQEAHAVRIASEIARRVSTRHSWGRALRLFVSR